MINLFKRLLNIKSLEQKAEDYVALQEELNLVKSEVDDLADFYNDRCKFFQDSLTTNDNEVIKSQITSKYHGFLIDHMLDVQKLKKKHDSIRSKIDKLEKSDENFLSAVKKYKEIKAFEIIKSRYQEDVLSRTEYDAIIKAKNGTVKYADMLVYDNQGKFLILQRSNDDDFAPNTWSLPGGHVDAGETFDDAAQRELQEETGLEVKKCEKVGQYSDSKVKIEYHRSTVDKKEPEVVLHSEEHQNYKWLYWEDAKGLDMIMNLKDNLSKIFEPYKQSIVTITKALESGQLKWDNFEKAGGHKYIKREGVKGNYKYIYKEDSSGNIIGDGSLHSDYTIEEFNQYPQITSSVSKSDTTESVYITYKNKDNGKKIVVRFSGHENNAVKFGDQLNGYTATRNEILYNLGLKDREFIPNKKLSIITSSIKMKDVKHYEVADKTMKELYDLGAGADISKYKGKVAKNSNRIILGDKVKEEVEQYQNEFGQLVSVGSYVYKDISKAEGDLKDYAKDSAKQAVDNVKENLGIKKSEDKYKEKLLKLKELRDPEDIEDWPEIKKAIETVFEGFKQGQISKETLIDVLEKAKYIRREGTKGNYKYIYNEPITKGGIEIKVEENRFGVKLKKIKIGNNFDELNSLVKINKDNFYKNTVCNWKEINNIDFKPNYISESGSQYMIVEEGVFRKSDHWFEGVSTCSWLLDGEGRVDGDKIGFAKWEDFKAYSKEGITTQQKKENKLIHEAIKDSIRGEFVNLHKLPDNFIKKPIKKSEDDELQKARTGVYSDNATNRRLKRVGKPYGTKGVESPEDSKKPVKKEENGQKQGSDKSLEEHAKEASGSALEQAAKESPDPEIRTTAHAELDRREKEEKPQEEKLKEKKSIENQYESKKSTKIDDKLKKQLSAYSDDLLKKYIHSTTEGVAETSIQLLKDRGVSFITKEQMSKMKDILDKGNIGEEKIRKTFGGFSDEETIENIYDFLGGADNIGSIDNLMFNYSKNSVEISLENDIISMERIYDYVNKEVIHFSFFVNNKGKGIGTKIFNSQVEAYQKQGYAKIITSANKGDKTNGYYTWARLGYNIDDDRSEKLFRQFLELNNLDKKTTLPKLMETERGRKLWKDYGFGFSGTFDLSKDSESVDILNKYINGKSKNKK